MCVATEAEWTRSSMSLQDVPDPWNAPADNEEWVRASEGGAGSFGALCSMGPTQKRALAAALCQVLTKESDGAGLGLRIQWPAPAVPAPELSGSTTLQIDGYHNELWGKIHDF